MSKYTAIIKCDKCDKVLAEISAHHEAKPDTFVPQDMAIWQYGLPDRFCQDCLNGKNDNYKGG